MAAIDTEFQTTFASLLTPERDVVVVHSALLGFAHRFRMNARLVANHVLDLLREASGAQRTLVFPTYSFSFCRSREFDLLLTPSETGILSAAALASAGVKRSRQAVYSNAVIGPKGAELAEIVAKTAWGNGSAMEWFVKNHARYVTIGVPWHLSASIMHMAEEIVSVPYRYYKKFDGTMFNRGTYLGPIAETLFVRSLNVSPILDYEPATEILRKSDGFAVGASEQFGMEGANAEDVVSSALAVLRADPYGFVRNKAEVLQWVSKGREQEIDMLPPGSRFERIPEQ